MINTLEQFGESIEFSYPQSYLKVMDLNLIDFDHWFLMSLEQLMARKLQLEKRYPERKLVPFAGRYESDDIACFEIGQGERGFIVHDFAETGYERRQEFDNFWSWFISAIKELIGIE